MRWGSGLSTARKENPSQALRSFPEAFCRAAGSGASPTVLGGAAPPLAVALRVQPPPLPSIRISGRRNPPEAVAVLQKLESFRALGRPEMVCSKSLLPNSRLHLSEPVTVSSVRSLNERAFEVTYLPINYNGLK